MTSLLGLQIPTLKLSDWYDVSLSFLFVLKPLIPYLDVWVVLMGSRGA